MHKLKRLILINLLVLCSAHATADNQISGFDLGVAYDIDLGITAKYQRYSLFISGKGVAFDVRVKNFQQSAQNYYFYIDVGAFAEDHDGKSDKHDDRVGIRVPFGVHFKLESKLSAYFQLAPAIDFKNDNDFDVDAAIGIRYRF